MIITALAEKESQGVEYYLALSETTSTRDTVTKAAKKQGYLEIKACKYLNNNTLIITWAKGHLVRLKEPEEYRAKNGKTGLWKICLLYQTTLSM